MVSMNAFFAKKRKKIFKQILIKENTIKILRVTSAGDGRRSVPGEEGGKGAGQVHPLHSKVRTV